MADNPFTGPGVFWISSNTSDEAVFPYADFAKWYEEVHIPDVIYADPENPLPIARRYEAVKITVSTNGSTPVNPFLVVYKLPTLEFVTSGAFRRIPLHHEMIPEGGPIAKFASFRGRFARHAETWVPSGGQNGGDTKDTNTPGTLLVTEVVELSNNTPQDRTWYTADYMPQVTGMVGWQRSARFETVMENEIGGDKPPPPGGPAPPAPSTTDKPTRWLTLHEFGDVAGNTDAIVARMLSWLHTADVEIIELLAYHLERIYGEKSAAFAGGKESLL